jgi:HD-like signal output (HDOD) protein
MKKKVLFVDDEANVLQGLQRMLHSVCNEWDISTASSGLEALGLLAQATYDVIVTDMRMPGMDGAQLLTEVMKLYPQIVRIVLSGQSDQETIFRSVGPTHQYLSKPCDAATLKSTVDRACALRDVLQDESLRRLASQMQSLPSLPSLYTEILKELQATEPAIEKITRIITRDAGMTAKILQLVNSAFFGFYSSITDPGRAITILGLDKIRSLVLTIHIFSQFKTVPMGGLNLENLWRHNLLVGQAAKEIAKEHTPGQGNKGLLEEAFMAGLLHDTGILILMANRPAEYQQTLALAMEHSLALDEAERKTFGASHAEIGAYLLGLWGLPTPIVEAVNYHHRPSLCINQTFSALTAVHAADALIQAIKPLAEEIPTPLDEGYASRIGFNEHLSVWQALCREIMEKENAL